MKTKSILLALLSFLILGSGLTIYAKTPSRSISKNLITYSLHGRIKTFDPATKQQSDSGINGILSNSKNLVAYTKLTGNSTDPFVYITDLTTNTETKFPVKLTSNFNILNWSPQDKYLLVKEQAGYVGGLKGDIYAYPSGKLITQIDLLNEKVKWQNDTTLFYFQTDSNCISGNNTECNFNTNLTKLDLTKVSNSTIYNLNNQAAKHLPDINDLDIQDSQVSIDYTASPNTETSIQVDTVTKKVTAITSEKIISAKILKLLKSQNRDLDTLDTQPLDNGDKLITLRNSNHEDQQLTVLYHTSSQTFEIVNNN